MSSAYKSYELQCIFQRLADFSYIRKKKKITQRFHRKTKQHSEQILLQFLNTIEKKNKN